MARSRTSAAMDGFSTAIMLNPALAGSGCAAGKTALACEYRINKPSVALIHMTYGFNRRNLAALQKLDALRRFVLYQEQRKRAGQPG